MNIAMEQTEARPSRAGDAPSATRRAANEACADAPADATPLEQEYSNGQLKNKYGDAFIRGNNGARRAALHATQRATLTRASPQCSTSAPRAEAARHAAAISVQ